MINKIFLLTLQLFVFLSSLNFIGHVKGSVGDHLSYYRKCLTDCLSSNCSNQEELEKFWTNQPVHLNLTLWSCEEECKYQCQWSTIDFLLVELELERNLLPQFHGKWTFYRFFGIQEPASALFSLLNLVTTYLAWTRYAKRILQESPSDDLDKGFTVGNIVDPYFKVTTIGAILSMNAWLWSTVFHSRDTLLTERLDYFSAFSTVLFSFYAIVVRMIDEHLDLPGKRSTIHTSLLLPFISYYLYHVYYLIFVQFDYAFNMKANLVAGFSSSLLWLIWAYKRLATIPMSQLKDHHIVKCVISILLVNCLLIFEINDFPPIYFILDAHSIWHFGTICLPFLWFSFLEKEALEGQAKKKPERESSSKTKLHCN
ncbi:post-GPI attachment to proteins factor 3-like [Panonychus citri]|uniref:post-GPI attachment to proteins factor 3-like n=1 Tax=Panonychus citri TaxID=50023 RepID=UPI002307183E|nr:post-GPI attachment to proteins factor 3-like [Panonychus citri]XP_053214990.1 post-GPI attachment to proteins factor 3-like [Panonychus citri]